MLKEPAEVQKGRSEYFVYKVFAEVVKGIQEIDGMRHIGGIEIIEPTSGI
jgi:hypothetical protein